MTGQSALDTDVRIAVYETFAAAGRAPTRHELAERLSLTPDEVAASLGRLAAARVLVLRPSGDIWMAMPFSAVPTPFLVHSVDSQWWANCAWDAFGIPAALHVDGHVSSTCPDCGERIEIEIRDERPIPNDYVFHVAVPAARWWDDIVYT